MREDTLEIAGRTLPVTWVHTLVIGSGAAGLNAAVQLRANGVEDVLILSEGLDKGTSINTGSDKQTYYKLSLCGAEGDAPEVMAETYFEGGSMHGDLALVEASLSARAFLHLVGLGVPFPRDAFGQFVGYKTDHDPRQRATSIGPYTSREMCRALIREVAKLGVPVREGRNVVQLVTVDDPPGERRAAGAIVLGPEGTLEVYLAENAVFAVGGPGGLYRTSVYPEVHTGAIGLALMAGAKAQSLPESQYGLASIAFRWNVSGTYMQVVPRFISTEADGAGDPQEFMRPYFAGVGEMASMVFLKGYQWPFDWRKVQGGSSIVDILVYIETVLKGRRVFLDFRANPEGFAFADLSDEAHTYLTLSEALLETPIARLAKMNPGAIELYRDHGIDIAAEPLEVAVCAQHNNGGLAANAWWESLTIKHLFPVGEVNGSHGVYRPGGSALNAGQVGGFRAAEYIGHRYQGWTLDEGAALEASRASVAEVLSYIDRSGEHPGRRWTEERAELQARMSRAGAHIRSVEALRAAVPEAWTQWKRLSVAGDPADPGESLRNRQLCFAHAVYLEALAFALASGTGSRGSSIALDPGGLPVHDLLDETWRILPEDEAFRDKVLETLASHDGSVKCAWVPRRPLPHPDSWFETAWARFREGAIYDGE
ncbi:MAG: FAD-binding protein [Anaerolineae bacterium]|jgi:succinate dehydrogenase/fumarate reductase flavoprotein subunit|nr:FAD-binding protein [Anaerolineae bacterium]